LNQFTWNPDSDAEQQEIKLDENAINTIQNQPEKVFPIAIVVFAIWIATVLSLYNGFVL
jgi:hypothetical protein